MVSEEFVLQEDKLLGGEDEVLIPVQRVDVHRMKCLKFAEGELPRLAQFQRYLATTINPVTGEPYARDEFSAMIHFSLNLAFRYMAWTVEQEASQEAVAP